MENKRLERLLFILGLQAESNKKLQQDKLGMDALSLVKDDILIEEDTRGNIYITKGKADIYPCAVAHLDQVHDYEDHYTIFKDADVLFAFNGSKQVGIGGDDKCGIFLCIEMLIKYPTFKVVFFQDEEIGCIGSGNCSIDFFKDCAFILQGDRNHAKDDIINHTNGVYTTSKEFMKEAKRYYSRYGYSKAFGSVTDIGELVISGAGCSAVNLACGYLDAHTSREIVCISLLNKCLMLFEDIVENMSSKRWEHTPAPKYNYRDYDNYYEDFYFPQNSGTKYLNIPPKKDDYSWLDKGVSDYIKKRDNYDYDYDYDYEEECPNCGDDLEYAYNEDYIHCTSCLFSYDKISKEVDFEGIQIKL